MANFQYVALDASGQEHSGSVEAGTREEAIQQLQGQGLYPTKVGEAGKKAKGGSKSGSKSSAKSKGKAVKGAAGGKLKPKVLMIFTRQLATLIDSGLPLLRGLNVLAKQEPNPVLKGTLDSLADSVQGGSTFSESLSQHPRIFNKLYVNMVKAGELGGVLELVLNRLAEYQEKAQKLKNKIVSAMVYPVIVMCIAVFILTFLMIFIVPKFKVMFKDMDVELPLISTIVFNASGFLMHPSVPFVPNAVWLLILVVLGYIGFSSWGNTKAGRLAIDKFKLGAPLFGDIQRKSAIARFARTLGTLVTSGVPILQALNITKETSGNVVVSDAIEKVYDSVKEGESIVSPMQASSGVFPSMVISMVDVGEETGQLPDMLLKIADVYDDEVDNAVTALTSILEPIMIVFLAVVVGGIVFALFLPLMKVISELQS